MELNTQSSVDDVCEWIQSFSLKGGEKYIESIREKSISGDVLLSASPAEALALLGVTAVGHKVFISIANNNTPGSLGKSAICLKRHRTSCQSGVH